jgi:prepilin-type N-terminal cleavage/methylation domain-containing protein
MQSRLARSGLTLIELLVVLAILGFVAATVTVQLNGRLGNALLTQALSQWEFTDNQLRSHASKLGAPLTLQIEVGTNKLHFSLDPEDDRGRTTRTLGRGIRVSRIQTATQEITYGPASINFSGQGASETYFVELAGARGTRRLLVAGVTGQVTELTNEEDVEELLAGLLPSSVHAN